MTSRMRSQRKENQRKVIHLLLMKLIAPYTKSPKELSKIFITPANFDKKQKKQELRCIRYRKSTGKKQDFMPDGILFPIGIKRENPEFTPYKSYESAPLHKPLHWLSCNVHPLYA